MKDECKFKVNKDLYTKDIWEIIKDKTFTAGTPTYGGGAMSSICFPGKGQWQYTVLGTGKGEVFIHVVRKINTEFFIWRKLFDILGPISYLFDKKHDETRQGMEILRKELEEYINA